MTAEINEKKADFLFMKKQTQEMISNLNEQKNILGSSTAIESALFGLSISERFFDANLKRIPVEELVELSVLDPISGHKNIDFIKEQFHAYFQTNCEILSDFSSVLGVDLSDAFASQKNTLMEVEGASSIAGIKIALKKHEINGNNLHEFIENAFSNFEMTEETVQRIIDYNNGKPVSCTGPKAKPAVQAEADDNNKNASIIIKPKATPTPLRRRAGILRRPDGNGNGSNENTL